MLIIDSHCDTPSQIMRLRNLSLDNEKGHVDFPKLIRGDIGAVFFALYTPVHTAESLAAGYAMEMLAGVYDAVKENSSIAAMAFSPEDIIKNRDNGLISILIGMENGSPIRKSLPLLRLFHRLGVRYMTLTHNADNEIGDSAAAGKRWHGLSPFGIDVISEMNRLGMIIDVAHCSDETFFDCIKYSAAPVVSTHSCCRALASHKRNMSDEMIRAMADKGGVIQINFYPLFLSDAFGEEFKAWEKQNPQAANIEQAFIDDPADKEKREAWERTAASLASLKRPGVKEVVDHIDHAIKVGGEDHVGIGSDFDGIEVTPTGLEDISKTGLVFDEMRRRGYNDDIIEKVAGRNFFRVFKEVCSMKASAINEENSSARMD